MVFRQFQKDFLFREAIQHLGLAAFLLPLMLGNQNGIRGRLLRLGGLLFFCLVEKAGLVVQNISHRDASGNFWAVLPEILSHGDGMVGKMWGGLSLIAIQTVKTIDIAGFFWDF